MKLFNIPAKRTKGQCDAMRCTQTESLTPGWHHPLEDDPVTLCERHANELKAYIASTKAEDYVSNAEVIQEDNRSKISIKPFKNIVENISSKETDRTMALGMIPPRTLESILTDNLAVRSGAIESRQETAEKINSIAVAIQISDRETRDKADQLVALVHQEEKAIKAEIAAMYKPVKDAAKATKDRLDSWFGATLDFYSEAKVILKEKLGAFLKEETERETKALEEGNHEMAAECVTDASENVRYKSTFEYAIQNEGINLPAQFLVPDETQNDDIVKLLPRSMCRPNYDLISAIVKEHGNRVTIPDVLVIEQKEAQMKGVRTKKE